MNTKPIERAAGRVTLAVVVCAETKALYGHAVPVLDERATMRRVTLFHRGSARAHISQPERDAALDVIRARFEASS